MSIRTISHEGFHPSARQSSSQTHLSLEGASITDQELEAILKQYPKLKSLDLSECVNLTDACLAYIPHTIQILSLRSMPYLTEKCLDHLASFSNLVSLDLSETSFRMGGLEKLKDLPHLKHFYLWRCHYLKDSDLAWLSPKSLFHIDVSYSRQLTDKCLPFLKGAHVVNLDGLNFITDKGCLAFQKSDQLQRISLVRCRQITENVASNFPSTCAVQLGTLKAKL